MLGINIDRPIQYFHASFRFFSEGERHVSRYYDRDILLLVYEGVLRFSENGVEQEVSAGEYYIQKKGLYQNGERVSDAPKYLYIYLDAEWVEMGTTLPTRGTFDLHQLWPLMEKMDMLAHTVHCYAERVAVMYAIINKLYRTDRKEGVAKEIADYIDENYRKELSLEDICERFNFSKNHVINLFKRQYGTTPFGYLNDLRLARAMYLLEVTSDTIEAIAYESGFGDYSHFYRMFCRKNGISPHRWREKMQRAVENS